MCGQKGDAESAAQLLEARASFLVAHRKYLDAEAVQGAESAAAKERMQNTPATHLIASRGVWHVCCTLGTGLHSQATRVGLARSVNQGRCYASDRLSCQAYSESSEVHVNC